MDEAHDGPAHTSPIERKQFAKVAITGDLTRCRDLNITADGKPLIVSSAAIEANANGRNYLVLRIPLETCAIDIEKRG